jgi:ribosomal-protein-alanine N-acetyltransferase
MKIELATEDEYYWVAEQMAQSEPWIRLGVTQEQCMKTCKDPQHRVYIATIDDQPSGLIILHRQGLAGSPYIKSVCVGDGLRGQGIGAALVGFAENLFRTESKHIFLCVSSFNTRAKLFYERIGYHQVGEFKDYIIKGASELLLYKPLT